MEGLSITVSPTRNLCEGIGSLQSRHAIGLMLRRTRTELIETIERSRAIYSLLGLKYNEPRRCGGPYSGRNKHGR